MKVKNRLPWPSEARFSLAPLLDCMNRGIQVAGLARKRPFCDFEGHLEA